MRIWGLLRGLGLGALVVATGCGGSNRVLESITVTPTTTASGTTYTATGHYSADPVTVNNIPVAWFLTEFTVDPPGPNWDFTLSTSPITGGCYNASSQAKTFTMVAYAPQNPNAAASQSMPFDIFTNLVELHTTPSEDGFVAGTTPLNCPPNS